MTKSELKEKIKNRESVWWITDNYVLDVYKPTVIELLYLKKYSHIKDNTVKLFTLSGWSRYYEIDNLYKTKTEAEHYLNHANVTRTETLPFLTWEEFKSGNEVIFKSGNGKGYALVYNKGLDKIDLFDTDGVFWGIVESWQPTEENFYKAYDECVKLFMGE